MMVEEAGFVRFSEVQLGTGTGGVVAKNISRGHPTDRCTSLVFVISV